MIQFLKDHQNTATASTFKTKMFWAMETGTSLHTIFSVTSVSIMPLRRKGCCLSHQLLITVWHLRDILNLFLSWENAAHLFLRWQSWPTHILFFKMFIFNLIYSAIEPADSGATLHKT